MSKSIPDNVRPLRGSKVKSGPAARRLRANWPAELRVGGSRVKCHVVDISPAGARVRCARIKDNMSAARLVIEHLPPILVEIMWRQHNHLGLQFVEEQAWVLDAYAERFDPAAWLKRR